MTASQPALTDALTAALPVAGSVAADLIRRIVTAGGSAELDDRGVVLTSASGQVTRIQPGVPSVTSTALVSSMPPLDIDPIPHAAVANALRIRATHGRLLATGAFDYESLAEGRGASIEATRKFVSRAQQRNELFTVEFQGSPWVPALLLNEELDVRPEFTPLIAALKPTGASPWAMWNWLVSPNGWLDGAAPVELLPSAPEQVLTAAVARSDRAA